MIAAKRNGPLVNPGLLYVPGLDVCIGLTEGDDGQVIHWTTLFEAGQLERAPGFRRIRSEWH